MKTLHLLAAATLAFAMAPAAQAAPSNSDLSAQIKNIQASREKTVALQAQYKAQLATATGAKKAAIRATIERLRVKNAELAARIDELQDQLASA